MSRDLALVVEALPAYEVGEEIGRGASGVVVAGRHRQLGREVAIKQLPREVGADPEVRARFGRPAARQRRSAAEWRRAARERRPGRLGAHRAGAPARGGGSWPESPSRWRRRPERSSWRAVAAVEMAAARRARPSWCPARPVTALSVKGNQLVTAAGRPVRLLGVNRDGTETKCTEAGGGVFDGPTDQTSVTAMARWNINAVRIPLHEACWLGINELPVGGTAAAHRRAIERYVQLLARNGMYAVLALHVAAPGRVRTTANEQLPLPDAGHGPAFWRSVARRFHDSPAVLFDLYGEPTT